MELLKSLVKNPKVIGGVLGALVLGLSLLLGVKSDEIKSAYCGQPDSSATVESK